MRSRWAIRLVIAVVVLATVVLLMPLPRMILVGLVHGEAFYKGRPTSYWRGVYGSWTDYSKKHPRQAFSGGSGGLPTPPSPSLLDRLTDPVTGLASASFRVLGEWEHDPAAVSVLTEFLSDPDPDVRNYAASTLRSIGPAARSALPRLTRLLSDEDAGVRLCSVTSVDVIEQKPLVKVPLYVGLLKDPDSGVRRMAATVLGNIGERSDETVAALTEALNDEDALVSREAALALNRIGPKAP
jgi:hypothetical protein